jgi:hypothetical protein
MSRSLLIFVACFLVGAAGALVARAALHHPYADAPEAAAPAPAAPPQDGEHRHPTAPPADGEHHHPTAPPADGEHHHPTAPPADDEHHPAPTAAPGPTAIRNTVCPVCGFEVDRKLPTSRYHDQVIGFACETNHCKAKFDADPERYGPAALANRKGD